MSVVVKRPPRAAGPEAPHEQVELAEPPVLGEPAQMEFSSALMMLPMGLGGGAMVLMFAVGGVGGGGSSMMYVFGGVMGVSVITMGLSQIGRGGRERSRKMRAERRDYLRYLGQLRRRAREAAGGQRRAVEWNHPDPARLRPLAGSERVWERRPSHDDFARVRIGRGSQRAGLEFLPPATKPVEDLEPLTAVSLRRFARTHRLVPDVPLSATLRSVRAVELAGDPGAAAGLLRAMLGQLAVWHSPDELTVAVLTDAATLADWQWVKWLPHAQRVPESGGPGPLPLVADDPEVLLELLGPEVRDRPGHDPAEPPTPGEPFVVVVACPGTRIPRTSRLRAGGLRGLVVLDATGELPGGPEVLRLTLTPGDREDPRPRVTFAVAVEPVPGSRTEADTATAVADALDPAAAEELARALAPLRSGGIAEVAAESFDGDLELTTLLGIRDAHRFDVARQWQPRRAQRARLTVPIGVTEDGEVIDLDLKESAQGGMGPHGVLIGATGSGKSELLRTLVIGLAATHSSEVLNMVLVDFKGGATFLGMDRLPHTSATITNLADELPLVDRMQDSINGELLRRQELLRAHGYASLYDYEAARGAGEPLDPLPTLLVVVDEFSELLAAKPEFMDLFVQIGRVGRSLGVHLLLASQRLDEGRIHRVEGHLSYRIALRTFSAMESRSVIGVPSAYELPSSPGNGYLKIDTASLARFKAAYVSGPCPEQPLAPAGTHVNGFVPVAAEAVTDFVVDLDAARRTADDTRDRARAEAEEAEREAALAREKASEPVRAVGQASLLDVLIARLEGAGPEARQVWLPPLASSPGLDELLPPIVPDPERGLVALGHDGRMRIPVGVIDRPAEQVRDLLVADLTAAGGHAAVVGGPQSGKSTLLRTVALALALTHTPTELQIYAIDVAGGGLAPIAGLPHVGSVATRLERDRVQRTVAELATLLELREEAFAALGVDSMGAYRRARAAGRVPPGRGGETDRHGEVVLLVDGWGTLRTEFPDLETRITELAGRASAFGVHVVVGSGRWSEIRPALRNLLGTRLELRLGDPVESEVGARLAATVPSGQPGRGLTSGREHFLAALPRLEAPAPGEVGEDALDHASATRAAVADVATFWAGEPAPAVRLLPASLPASSLPAAAPRHGAARVCLGLDEQRLAPVWHDFGATPHLLALGDDETGRSNLLRLVASSIVATNTPTQARVLMADTRRRLHEVVPEEYRIGYAMSTDGLTDLAANAAVSMTKRLPGEDVTPEALARRDWWSGPALYLLVDDYDLFTVGGSGSPLQPLVPLLAQGAHIGLHLVIARSTSSAMRGMMDPVLRRMWELGNPGLLFSYPKEEGKFLGEAQPRQLPPGRAQLVTRRGIRLLQTGLVDPVAGATVLSPTGAGTPGQR